MGRQSWSEATVFGLDPEVGFVWEEQKGRRAFRAADGMSRPAGTGVDVALLENS